MGDGIWPVSLVGPGFEDFNLLIDAGAGINTVLAAPDMALIGGHIYSEGGSDIINAEVISVPKLYREDPDAYSSPVYTQTLGYTYIAPDLYSNWIDYSGYATKLTIDSAITRTSAVLHVTDGIKTDTINDTDLINSIVKIVGSNNGDTFNLSVQRDAHFETVWLGEGNDVVNQLSNGLVKVIYSKGDDILSALGDGGISISLDANIHAEDVSVTANTWDTVNHIHTLSLSIDNRGTINYSKFYNGSDDSLNLPYVAVTLANGQQLDIRHLGAAVFTGTAQAIINAQTPFDDVLFNSAATPTLYGGAGDDFLYDRNFGGVLFGGAGNDELHAGSSVGTFIEGGIGNDRAFGGAGVDTLHGGFGDDELRGAANNDFLYGEAGNDTLLGEAGDDFLSGGAGNDTLQGGKGNDILIGGAGEDIYIFNKGDGEDTIIDSSPSDKLMIGAGVLPADLFFSQVGNDLHIHIGSGVLIKGWFLSTDNQIGNIQFADGTVITAAQVEGILANGGWVGSNNNLPPIAQNDIFDAAHGGTVSGNILTNDSDPNGDTLKVVAQTLTMADGGQVIIDADGSVSYHAAQGFRGSEHFSYAVEDGAGGSATATVEINNVFTNRAPVAVDDVVSAVHGATVSGNVLTNDSDPDGDNLAVIAQNLTTVNGNQVIVNADGSFAYAAALGFKGDDSFNYTVQDSFGATSTATTHISDIFNPAPPSILLQNAHLSANVAAVLTSHQYAPAIPVFPMLSEHHTLAAGKINGVNPANLTLENSFDVKVNFVTEGAGYKNTLGYYTVDANGTISNVHVMAKNLSGTGAGVFGGGSYHAGDPIADLGVLPTGTHLGFFIIADGYNANKQFSKFDLTHGHFEFIDMNEHRNKDRDDNDHHDRDDHEKSEHHNATSATLGDHGQNVQLVYINDTTGKMTNVNGNLYHSDSSTLNSDGAIHTISGVNANGNLQIGFEDLYKGGDKDFNDAVIEVQFAPHVTHALMPFSILSGVTLADPNSGILSSATVSFTAGKQTGDQLSFNHDVLTGTNISVTTNADHSITLTGNDTTAHYQQILQALQYGSTAADPAAGLRSFNITVTDDLNLSTSSTLDINVGNSGLQPITPSGTSLFAEVDAALSHVAAFAHEDGCHCVTLTVQELGDLHHGVTMQDGKGNDHLTLNIADILDSSQDDILAVLGDKGDTLNITGGALTNAHTETHNGNLYNVFSAGHGVTLAVDADITTVQALITAG